MTTGRLFAVSLALPILFTALVLFTVQRNRSAGRAPMVLTQRELILTGGSDANSGIAARLAWSAEGRPDRTWLIPARLEALGFDVTTSRDRVSRLSVQLQRRAYVVLELRPGQPTRSRLVPVDAGLDPEELSARYPDGRTHLITAGVIALQESGGTGRRPSMDGYLVSLDPPGIHIPTALAGKLRQPRGTRPLFTVTVRYGSRLEPWVEDVR